MTETEFNPGESADLESTIGYYAPQMMMDSGFALNSISQIAMLASREFGKHPLKEMQQILERKGVDAQLVAIPVESEVNRIGSLVLPGGGMLASDIKNYDIRMPHSGDKDYPYWLWITVGRRHEYNDLLQKLGTTPQENLERLSQTGMLTVRTGTELSRISSAGEN